MITRQDIHLRYIDASDAFRMACRQTGEHGNDDAWRKRDDAWQNYLSWRRVVNAVDCGVDPVIAVLQRNQSKIPI